MDCSPPGSCDNCLGDRQSSLTYFFAFDFPLMSWNSGLFLFPSVKLGTWKNLSSNWPRPQGNFARLSVLSWSGPSSMALSLTLLQGRIHFSFLTHISTVFCSFFYHKTFDTDVLSSMHNLFLFPEDLYIVVQSLCHIQLFVTPWTAAHKASLSFSISWSLLKSKVLGYSSSSSNDVMVNHLQINYLYLATSSQHTYIPNMQERGKKN